MTALELRRGETARTINALQQNPPDTAEYALVSKDRKLKPFRKQFASLWLAVVRRVVPDPADKLVAALTEWLNPMTTSALRALRHTATVAVLAIQSALATVCAELQRELVTAGQRRPAKPRAGGHAEQEAEATVTRLEGLWQQLFTSYVVVRPQRAALGSVWPGLIPRRLRGGGEGVRVRV